MASASIEDSFETARNELSLDHNETRSFDEWPRHVSLVMLAAAMMAVLGWSIQEVRRIAKKVAQRRTRPAHIVAWSYWRRAHQAAARMAHHKNKPDHNAGIIFPG